MLVKINKASAIVGPYRAVKVGDKTALIDEDDAARICGYKWYPRYVRSQCYAVRKKGSNGKIFRIAMHRQITHCPASKIVHHINRNGLDNRKCNLEVMNQTEHHEHHKLG